MAITDQLHHRSMMQQTNDMYMSMYIAALIRTVMAIHDLISNQIKYGIDGNTDHKDDSDEIVTANKTMSTTNEKNKHSTSQEEKKEWVYIYFIYIFKKYIGRTGTQIIIIQK